MVLRRTADFLVCSTFFFFSLLVLDWRGNFPTLGMQSRTPEVSSYFSLLYFVFTVMVWTRHVLALASYFGHSLLAVLLQKTP